MSDSPVFVLLNVYSTVLTQGRAKREAEVLGRHLREMLEIPQVTITAGELAVEDASRRKISASVFARASFG